MGVTLRASLRLIVAALMAGAISTAQSVETPESRTEEIQLQRKRKAAQLRAEEASRTEQALIEFRERRILEKITYGIGGLRARIGALVTGSGFAAGPEYFRDDLNDGNLIIRATTQFSVSKYQLYDLELNLPKLAQNRAFFELHATHRNYPQMQYFGPGPDSKREGRSDFRLEDTAFSVVTGVKPISHLRLGVIGGFTEVNVGPGTDDRYANAEILYSPTVAPGINHQTDFLQSGVFAQYDTRDIPGGPRSGGNYIARFTYNKDSDLNLHTFRKLDVELQHYIPLFNARRVIALRAKSELTYENTGQTVPFYMQPTLGGSNDLRGFRPFRFYDDNLVVFNAEYRYEVFAGLDMAVFADAGKVFRTASQLNLHDLEGAYGIGMRFNARNAVFMRIDAGFSHEGFQVWLKFNNVF
jgi:outer membrane protein assembly factor BamA